MRSSTLFIILAASLLVLLCCQFILEVYLDGRYEENYNPTLEEIAAGLVVVWWDPVGSLYENGVWKQCGQHSCYFTSNRTYRNHPQTKAFMFYGSNINFTQLPLPRGDALWALLHEESPRNNGPLSHSDVISLFNLTATFSRSSDYPLTTQYLKHLSALTDLTYFVSTDDKDRLQSEKKLAPVMYIQSDCSTPLDRDSFVVELSKYIEVDSYGQCLHNKDLPKHLQQPHGLETMMADDLLHLTAEYKFVLAIENAVCEDYITEKLWRPLISGSVPVYIGSPSVADWLPNNKSAILGQEFASPRDLAMFLKKLNKNNEEYNSYLNHKLVNSSVTNMLLKQTLSDRDYSTEDFDKKGNFIENFACFVCEKAFTRESSVASEDHYFCPMPISIVSKAPNASNFWLDSWFYAKCEAQVIRNFADSGVTYFSQQDFYDEVKNLVLDGKCQFR